MAACGRNNNEQTQEGEMRSWKTSIFTASGLAAMAAFAWAGAAFAQDFKKTYDEIVATAKSEPAVQWCTGLGPDESQPIVDAFMKLYPDVPEPNDFECFGEDATQRVISEWEAGVTQVDIINVDTEIVEDLDKNNKTHLQDWAVFKGTPIEIDPRYLSYGGRFFNTGFNHRVIWFNPTLLKREDAPKSFDECADPKYKGILAMDVRPTFFEMMKEAGGPWDEQHLKEWAAAIAKNEPLWTRGAAHNFQVLSSGERGLNCGQQLHGLFRGKKIDPTDPNAPVQFIIPKQVLVRGYQTTAIAPQPNAPNGTILFGAFLASDKGQAAIAESNPGYASPFAEGTFTNRVIKEAGAEILFPEKETIGSVADKLNQIILTEWGFPSAAPH
jgi:ABC-type Fe3+ transport system substrate-binding protein